jgi:hypothetical protein
LIFGIMAKPCRKVEEIKTAPIYGRRACGKPTRYSIGKYETCV